MSVERFDVVVIGAGAGGAASAWALTRGGRRVLVLESGPAFDPTRDYRLHREDWELERFPHKPGSQGRYTFGPLQRLEARWDTLRSWGRVTGRLNDTDTRRLAGSGYQHVRGTGGSTLHFTGEAHRLHPEAMRMHSRFGVAADWPLDYAELEPFYVEAEAVVGVAGPEDPGVRWRSAPYPLPPHPLGVASRRVQAGCRSLGLSWVPNSRAALSRPYDGRPDCNYCGNCNRGCPRQDRGSADITFLRKALFSDACTLRTGCHVTRLETDRGGRIEAVHYVDDAGHRRRASGRYVVLAAGAVETPRLLLASAHAGAPEGLANASGHVGRNFMETLAWTSSALHAEPLASFKCLPSDSICWDYNAPDGLPEGIVGGCRFSMGTTEADLAGPVNYAWRVVPGWGRAHKAALREAFGRVVTIAAIGESLPNAASFVDLDPEERDAHGVPLARIHSHLPEGELRRLAFMARTCRRILEAAGAKELVEEAGTYDFFSTTHAFGTCRMGDDAGDSVVDRHGRAHGCPNLYITDGSVFPSSGGGESPSLTIQALALRSIAHLETRGFG